MAVAAPPAFGGELAVGTQALFDWIDNNGPAPAIQLRLVSVEILKSIAVVHLEVHGWTGTLVGATARASDVFTLLKIEGAWKITHKLFHWHYASPTL